MARNRQNVFTRHPDGTQILEQLLNKEITQVEAARKLGCTPANISIYLRTRKMRPTREERKPRQAPGTAEILADQMAAMKEFTIPIDGKTSSELTAAAGWQATLKGLLMMTTKNLEPDEYVKVANTAMRMMQFSFKNRVPDIPGELLKLDPETEDRIIQRLGEFCGHCPYLRAFNARKAIQQDKQRMEPTKSPSVGG